MGKTENIDELTFEQALARLEAIVQSIDQGKIGLEDSIGKYEEGMKLVQRCHTVLAAAEQKIQKVQLTQSGDLSTQPFQPPTGDNAREDA